jgi:hypothetical protein
MRGYTNGLLVAACLAVSPLFSAGPVHATAFDVTVDSTLLNGSTAVLAFDFNRWRAPEKHGQSKRPHLEWDSGVNFDYRERYRRRPLGVF